MATLTFLFSKKRQAAKKTFFFPKDMSHFSENIFPSQRRTRFRPKPFLPKTYQSAKKLLLVHQDTLRRNHGEVMFVK